MNLARISSVIPVASALLWSLCAHAELAYRLATIENPVGPNFYMSVIDLNSRGEVVGFVEGIGIRAFHWKKGVYTDLGTAVGSNSSNLEAVGINDRSVIVGNRTDGDPRTFRIRNNQLTPVDISPPGASAALYGINNRQQIFGRTQDQPFVWQRGVTTYLDALPGSDERTTQAWGINDRGVLTGTSGTLDNSRAVVWKNGDVIALELPPGATRAEGRDINNVEQVVGNAFLSGSQFAHLWTDGVPRELPPATAAASATAVQSINDWGIAVGTTFLAPSGGVPTLWLAGKAIDLNTMIASDDPLQPHVTLSQAYHINNRGQIVATGFNAAEGESHPYLLTPTYRPRPIAKD